jgi:copper chaperone NosL
MRDARRALGPAVLGALAVALLACGPPEGPQPIVWDREPCAHCRMLISDPAFAAQLHLADGTVESFDDPGCLFARLEAQRPRVHALWFHHVREDRWLRGDAVAFERVAPTPMDFGLGAVDAGAAAALSLEAAQAHVRTGAGAR